MYEARSNPRLFMFLYSPYLSFEESLKTKAHT
ncbi:hypothetical protein PAEAM_44660 [Paenibacillus sp. GM1FR]|nr:hypothetical protein [Paenibacillus xylanexedens]PJN52746.1 hypothetical protein PAEAM_44660 [Paenibacillus sp. GM1FR]